MFGVAIDGGALFYGTNRRRTEVRFDDELRGRTEGLCARMQDTLRGASNAARVYAKKCESCSLDEQLPAAHVRQGGREWRAIWHGRFARRRAVETILEYAVRDDAGRVSGEGRRDGAVRVEQEIKLRVPIHTLSAHRVFRAGFVQSVPDGLVRRARAWRLAF